MLGNGPAWFGGGPHGKGVPSRKPPRRAAYPVNERGFDALDPKWNGGTPNKIDQQTRDWICVIARCDPRFLGRPFSGWSLSKLRDYLIEVGRVDSISIETVRRILHERGCSPE